MYKFFSIVFLFLMFGAFGQVYAQTDTASKNEAAIAASIKLNKYDSTLKIGKYGYRVTCTNRSLTQNPISIKPIGFKAEAREINLELKARIISSEVEFLNNDEFPDLLIYILESSGKKNLFCVSAKSDDGKQPLYMQPIYMPDITVDTKINKGYRGGDEYELNQGILWRTFPIYDADTTIKTPTNKVRKIFYHVVEGDRGVLTFKDFKSIDYIPN